MKVVYIQPASFFSWESLSFGYIGAYCKKHAFADQCFFSSTWDSEESIIENAADADVVGFSCASPQMKDALRLARVIKAKNPKVWTVFGGIHPTVLSEQIATLPEVDSVVVGEGEASMLKILNGCRDAIVRSPYIQNLDSIPHPDRELIKLERHLNATYEKEGRRITSVFTSRACPFNCVFCASKAIWGRKQRLRSPQNIAEEFEILKRDWKIDQINFADDEVGINKTHFTEFCNLLISQGNDITWGCNMVVSTVSEDLLNLMKKAGCTELFMGVESGSPPILKAMNKPYTIEHVKKAFAMTKRIGFKRRAYVLLGMPKETIEDIKMTENLIDEIDVDIVGFTILAPFPGTKFYDPVKHKDVDWSEVDEYRNKITATETLSNKDLHEIQMKLVKKYKNKIAYHHMLYE